MRQERRSTYWTLILIVSVLYLGAHIVAGIDRVAQRAFENKGSVVVKHGK